MNAATNDVASRAQRHQLAFELVGVVVLLAATGQVALVVVPAAALLPATRRVWVDALRRGPGTVPTAAAAVVAALVWGWPWPLVPVVAGVTAGAIAMARARRPR